MELKKRLENARMDVKKVENLLLDKSYVDINKNILEALNTIETFSSVQLDLLRKHNEIIRKYENGLVNIYDVLSKVYNTAFTK